MKQEYRYTSLCECTVEVPYILFKLPDQHHLCDRIEYFVIIGYN